MSTTTTPTRLPWPWNGVSLGLRALAALSPDLAGRLAFQLFATPRRGQQPLSAGEERLLESAERFTVPFEGGELAAYRWGEGPVVLLVHGWESHAGRMRAFVGPLLRRGFQVVALDGPAHGASPGKRTNLPAFRDAIHEVARAVGPLHAIIAHSFGAAATMFMLGEYEDVAVGRVVLSGSPSELALMIRTFARRLQLSPAVVQGIYRHIERRFGVGVSTFSVAGIAPRIDLPALLIHDRDDSIVPFSEGEAIAAAWPTATFLPTEGLDHRGVIRTPSVIRQVVAFVSGEEKASEDVGDPRVLAIA